MSAKPSARSAPKPSASACSNSVLRKASRRLGQMYDDALAPSGLRATQYSLLVNVQTLNAPTMRELADAIVMDLSALGHTLKPLARDGFVDMVPDERDRRAKRIHLTPAGEAKLKETGRLWQDMQARFERAFGAGKAAELREVLAYLSSQDFQEAVSKA